MFQFTIKCKYNINFLIEYNKNTFNMQYILIFIIYIIFKYNL